MGILPDPRGILLCQDTLKLLHVYQYTLHLSKEVLYVSVCQWAAKLQRIKVLGATIFGIYVVNRYSLLIAALAYRD